MDISLGFDFSADSKDKMIDVVGHGGGQRDSRPTISLR